MSKSKRKQRVGREHAAATERDAPSAEPYGHPIDVISSEDYQAQLHVLQIELVKLQRHFIAKGERILILLEGRDASGKDGSIKRIIEYLSPRETRVVALGKPSDHDRRGWYFRRYVGHLPFAEEMVIFNRSWYNRAGVEPVMGFCSAAEQEAFMQAVPRFEALLVDSGIQLLKYYLDISRAEQKRRLAERARDPLKQWKSSPVDAVALKHWRAYSSARDNMLLRTHTTLAPWHIVHSDNKRLARLNLIRDLLSRLDYAGKDDKLLQVDPRIAFVFSPDCLDGQRLAP